jgi:hypothetical protein
VPVAVAALVHLDGGDEPGARRATAAAASAVDDYLGQVYRRLGISRRSELPAAPGDHPRASASR